MHHSIKIEKYYRTNSCIILLKHINISKTSSIRRNKSMDHPLILNTTPPWLLQILLIHYSPSSTSPHCPTLSFTLLNRVWYALLSGFQFQKPVCHIFLEFCLHELYKPQEEHSKSYYQEKSPFSLLWYGQCLFKLSLLTEKIHYTSVMIQIRLKTKYPFHRIINFTTFYSKTRVATSRQ